MIIDINAYLGHFAFRQLRYRTADSLMGLMDRKLVDKAVVSSANAITYRNAEAGNEELAAEVGLSRPHLSQRFKNAGLPSVGHFLLWARLFHAGHWRGFS